VMPHAKDEEKTAAHIADYEDKFLSPFRAAELGYIDEVIQPQSTRKRVSEGPTHRNEMDPRVKPEGNGWGGL